MVAVAKTGSGKTCGFLLPALARLRQSQSAFFRPKKGEPAQPKVLVLAPTRELAQQIAGEAEKFAAVANSRVVALYGGVPKGDQVRELAQGAELVISTPGRLLDFSAGRPEKGQGPSVSMKSVAYLVLDEADRMLDMGFEPDIRKIIGECPKCGHPEDHLGPGLSASSRQTLFFTATWPRAVQRTAASLVSQGAVQIRIGQGAGGDKLTANTDVVQVVTVIDEKQKLTQLKELLEKELGPGESAFVFAKTRHTCDYLEKMLWDEKEDLSIGTWCRAIHSHREQWERDGSLETFRSITLGRDNGRRGILVATDVAARGLDIPGVAMVVVFDFGYL
jgi:ATP-dependent RNA helicase DDX5/DBP2